CLQHRPSSATRRSSDLTPQTDISDLCGAPQVFAWTNIYDSLNRCVRTTDNVGNASHCAYDSLSRVEVMFNPREYSLRRSYDLLRSEEHTSERHQIISYA